MSKSQKIYFDNAATSFPKPQQVLDSIVEYLNSAGNPGRGAHDFAMFGARSIMESRQTIAKFLGIAKEERLIFTPGCTHGINYVIKGMYLSDHFDSEDIVVISGLEHNSVTRPLEQVKTKASISIEVLDLESERVQFLEKLEQAVSKPKVKLCVLTAASNVTGQVLPWEEAASICKKYGVPVLVDAAQVAGKLPVDLSRSDVSYWCTSGHKGLMGPPGVGLLYVKPGCEIEPLIQGGTGSNSEDFSSPTVLPDRYEAGTLPGANIFALAAGVEFISQKDLEAQLKIELELLDKFVDWTNQYEQISVYGPGSRYDTNRVPVVSISFQGYSPGELAHILSTKYSIAVRPGLHCSAQAHTSLGTIKTGLTRISFGPQNTENEIDFLTNTLASIMKEKVR